jgi:hypothetical protein
VRLDDPPRVLAPTVSVRPVVPSLDILSANVFKSAGDLTHNTQQTSKDQHPGLTEDQMCHSKRGSTCWVLHKVECCCPCMPYCSQTRQLQRRPKRENYRSNILGCIRCRRKCIQLSRKRQCKTHRSFRLHLCKKIPSMYAQHHFRHVSSGALVMFLKAYM